MMLYYVLDAGAHALVHAVVLLAAWWLTHGREWRRGLRALGYALSGVFIIAFCAVVLRAGYGSGTILFPAPSLGHAEGTVFATSAYTVWFYWCLSWFLLSRGRVSATSSETGLSSFCRSVILTGVLLAAVTLAFRVWIGAHSDGGNSIGAIIYYMNRVAVSTPSTPSTMPLGLLMLGVWGLSLSTRFVHKAAAEAWLLGGVFCTALSPSFLDYFRVSDKLFYYVVGSLTR